MSETYKNQDQLLTQHVELKSKIGSEPWVIVDRSSQQSRAAVGLLAFRRRFAEVCRTNRLVLPD